MNSPGVKRVPRSPPDQDQNVLNDRTESGLEVTGSLKYLPVAELCEAQRSQASIVDWIRKQRIANSEQREREDLGGHIALVQLAFRLNHEDKKEIVFELFKGERRYIKDYFLERQRIIEEEKRRLQERVNLFEPDRGANERLGNNLVECDDVEKPSQRQVDENVQLSANVPEQARSPGDHQGMWDYDSGEEADDEESDQEDEDNNGGGPESGELSSQSRDSHEGGSREEGSSDDPEREHGREGEFDLVDESGEGSVEPAEDQDGTDDDVEISDSDLDLGEFGQKIHDDVNRILDGQDNYLEGKEENAHLQMRLGNLALQFHAQRISRLRAFHDTLLSDEVRRLGELLPQEAREIGDLILDLYHQLHLIELGAKHPFVSSKFFGDHKKKIQEFWCLFQDRHFHNVLSHPYYRIFDEIPLFGMPYFTQKEAKDPDTKDPLEFALPVHFDHRVNKMQKRRPGR